MTTGMRKQREEHEHSRHQAQILTFREFILGVSSFCFVDLAMTAVRAFASRIFSTKGLERRLQKQGQVQLVSTLSKLGPAQKQALIRSIKSYSLLEVQSALKQAQESEARTNQEHKPLAIDTVLTVLGRTAQQADEWNQEGLALLGQGKVGILLLAGGQGTRLGSNDPKGGTSWMNHRDVHMKDFIEGHPKHIFRALVNGCFSIGLPSGKSLFQLHCERILRLQLLAECFTATATGSCRIFLYVLTSAATHAPTVSYFAAHDYFGLDRSQIMFFQQGSLPCLSSTGDAIVQQNGAVRPSLIVTIRNQGYIHIRDTTIATAPDGNGGLYMALHHSGALRHMRTNGVHCVDCCAVDNAAARIGDPLFIGACWHHGAEIGARTVAKVTPEERVGVFARRGSHVEVVEYSEMTKQQACERDAWGRLQYGWSNVCMHYFSVPFLQKAVKHLETSGPRYHIARKQIPSMYGPVQGMKLEQFIFDVFPIAESVVLLEVRRGEEFAPVKNSNDQGASDTPDTARRILMTLHRKWIEDAGGKFNGSADGGVEVSPLVSYAGEGLTERCCGELFTKNSLIA